MMKKILALCIAILALAAMIPATLAYDSYITYPYAQYWTGGQTRATAYTSTWGPNQGLYNYVSPPIGVVKYDHRYKWGSNVRSAQYGGDQYLPSEGPYRPYFGYPAHGWQSPHTYAVGY